MSANAGTHLNRTMTEGPPDSPVRRVEVEHADGTTRILEGDEANLWVSYVSSALKFAHEHGGRSPDVDWEEKDDNE